MIEQRQVSHRSNSTSWKCLSNVIIAIIFFIIVALLWIMNTKRINQNNWSYILPILFTACDVIFTLQQWLLRIYSDKPIVPEPHLIPQQPYSSFLTSQFRSTTPIRHYPYDLALCYSWEYHDYFDAFANIILQRHSNGFYDKYDKFTLWGKKLYTYLFDLYQNEECSRRMFLSQQYATKLQTIHSHETTQAHVIQERKEYILPVYLDGTEIPGILLTISFLRCPPELTKTIYDTVNEKLNASTSNLRSEPWSPAAWHQASEMSCRGNSANSMWKHLASIKSYQR